MALSAATIGIISAVTAVAGLGVSAVGSVMQGRQQQAAAAAQSEGQRQAYLAQQQGQEIAYRNQQLAYQEQQTAYKEQAEAARRNRAVTEENVLATEKAGAWEVEKARLKALRLGGTQAAGYAKAGVLLEGSPLEVMAETAANEELDILATQYNYSVQATRYRNQGAFYGFEADRNMRLAGMPNPTVQPNSYYNQPATPNYMTSGLMKAGTSLLTGGAGLVKNYWSVSGGSANAFSGATATASFV